jgi:radical SAM superfamily enzyme YgiQ (UPF0313 family)
MKVLLVVPASDGLRVTRENPAVPKRAMQRFSILPVTTVAALTPPRHEVRICDENVQALDFDADCDVVGVSFMTALAPRAYEIAREFRRRGKVVVAGGYYPTLCPGEVTPHFDAVVAGEAEGVWPRVLEDIEAGRLKPLYRAETPADPAEIPIPRRDLLRDTAAYYVTTAAVQTGRGCRHACRYCSIAAFYGGSRRNRPVERVIEELKGVPRDFMFVDDNIIADPDYARRLFLAMVPLGKRWVSQCSIQIADDPELLGLAARAGCRGLFVGVETTDRRNLEAVGKGFNAEGGLCDRIGRIRAAGIGVVAGVIVGMDNDDVTVFERTLRFLQAARIDTVQVNIMTPLPGTPLHADMERQGRMTDRDLSHYDFRHCVFRPARMTAAELQDGADWLYSQFYRLDRILGRFVRAVFSIGWVPAWLGLRLGLTYRYDNIREGTVGRNPAAGLAARLLLRPTA